MTTERRRSERFALGSDEIAVVHDAEQDRPATLIDFSATGALLTLVDFPGIPDCSSKVDDPMEISFQSDYEYFYVKTKVVRSGPRFLAVEFVETRPESLKAIKGKVRRLSSPDSSKTRAARA